MIHGTSHFAVGQAGTPVSDSENGFLDSQYDVRMSPAMNRRRIGSFNSGGENALLREDGASPGTTFSYVII